ncbi:MAG: hypothetical protein LC623_09790, partial [Halobacteriales archaeon]|nr:hypothetical protein [Halobacteriales archaeon]
MSSSRDGGRTYAPVFDAQRKVGQAPAGIFDDGSLALDAQGTLYYAGMQGEGDDVALLFEESNDGGRTWGNATELARGHYDQSPRRWPDRQWVASSPDGHLV